MILEKDFEEIVAKYPELIEDGLTLKGRQVSIYGRRMDLLFEDKFRRKLIVELKIGPIKDAHIGQVLAYEGTLLSNEYPTIRVMLIGNRVPPNIQRSLDHHGIAWREITLNSLKEFLKLKNDLKYLGLFASDEQESLGTIGRRKLESEIIDNSVKSGKESGNIDELVFRIKSSEDYGHFREILPRKLRNEEKAKAILNLNLGKLDHNHIKEITNLVDEPYPAVSNGKVNKGPWFNRLLKCNTMHLYNESVEKLNNWFSILTNSSIDIQERMKLLLNEPNKIKGLNVGFITLILYILNKKNYLIWFEGQHDSLTLFYPDLEKYSGSIKQYSVFNDQGKIFAKAYNFDHTELDWIFSAGVKVLNSKRR